MSLLNFWTEPDRALVAVDTAVGAPTGERFEQSKMLLLPHANVLFAARGELLLLTHVFQQAQFGRLTFDTLLEGMPAMLGRAVQTVAAHAAAAGLPLDWTGVPNQLVIVGWSEHMHCLGAANYVQRGQAEFAGNLMSWALAPSEPFGDGASALPPQDEATMLECARAQVAWIRRTWRASGASGVVGSEPIAGGRLLVAELTRHEVSIKAVPLAHARAQDRST